MHSRVLVVDDDDIIRTAIAEYLVALGYEVDTAEDAGAAMEKLRKVRYGIVVTEINFPNFTGGYSGRYLLGHIRYRSPWSKVIVITGDASIDTGLEAIRLGACYWLTKPFSLTVLRDRIAIVLNLNSLRLFSRSIGMT